MKLLPTRARICPATLLAVCALALLTAGVALAHDWSPEYEAKVGRETLDQIKHQYKLWDKPDEAKRVQEILNNLKAVSPRPTVEYQVVLLDTKEVNAMSLPGGYVCVTRGLSENVQSTDELAGVLAHEMAHNCAYDALNEAKRTQELTMPVLAAMIAAMVTGGRAGTAALAEAGVVITQGILSTYSIQIESRADLNGLIYLIKCGKYNPVGMLTFMERLALEERSGPQVTMGIYQTHPLSVDRVTAIADQLQAAGVTLNRRAVTKWDPPTVVAGKLGEQPVQILSLWGAEVLDFDWAPAGTDMTQRGAALVKTLTDCLAAGTDGWEFSGTATADGATIQARGQEILHLYPEDAKLRGCTLSELLAKTLGGLDSAFFTERLKRRY